MNDSNASVEGLSDKQRAVVDIKALQAKLDRAEQARAEPIAVIGLSCRFPGAADPQAYWRLLRDGVDAVTEVPPERWDVSAYYDPDPERPGKTYTRCGGFSHGIELFDADFFGIVPREAQSMDP